MRNNTQQGKIIMKYILLSFIVLFTALHSADQLVSTTKLKTTHKKLTWQDYEKTFCDLVAWNRHIVPWLKDPTQAEKQKQALKELKTLVDAGKFDTMPRPLELIQLINNCNNPIINCN